MYNYYIILYCILRSLYNLRRTIQYDAMISSLKCLFSMVLSHTIPHVQYLGFFNIIILYVIIIRLTRVYYYNYLFNITTFTYLLLRWLILLSLVVFMSIYLQFHLLSLILLLLERGIALKKLNCSRMTSLYKRVLNFFIVQ